jgi:hypothetical protein
MPTAAPTDLSLHFIERPDDTLAVLAEFLGSPWAELESSPA